MMKAWGNISSWSACALRWAGYSGAFASCSSVIIMCALLVLTPVGTGNAITTSVEVMDGFPQICVDGAPYFINGWTIPHIEEMQTADSVIALMDQYVGLGFELIELGPQWWCIEEHRDACDWSQLDACMAHAESLGLSIILQPYLGTAPAWFADSLYLDAVFVTHDPDSLNPEYADELRGELTYFGYASFPVFYHPGYLAEAGEFLEEIIARYKGNPSLFGWLLATFFTAEYNYPGGHMYDIGGFADYSDYTVGLYGSTPPEPLCIRSQTGPDTRAEWLEWTRFRVEKKRETLDIFARLMKRADPDHILMGYPGGIMMGEMSNGFCEEAMGADFSYFVRNPNIDVMRVAPQVAPNVFDCMDGLLSFLHYVMPATMQVCLRYGKPMILQCERGVNDLYPSVDGYITTWALFHRALGYHFLWWQEPSLNDVSGMWTPSELAEIEATRHFDALPQVSGITHSRFAMIDLPFEYGKYYPDSTYSLTCAMIQASAFMDAGLPFNCIDEGEVMEQPALLDSYDVVGVLEPSVYSLLAPASLTGAVDAFANGGGNIWLGDVMRGLEYFTAGFASDEIVDTLRAYYDSLSLPRHRYNGYRLLIAGNKPYVFVYARDRDFNGAVEISILGWGLEDGDYSALEVSTGAVGLVSVAGHALTLEANLPARTPHLYLVNTAGVDVTEASIVLPEKLMLTLSPNPFSGSCRIGVSGTAGHKMKIEVFDLMGRVVFADDGERGSAQMADEGTEPMPMQDDLLFWTPDGSIGSGICLVRASSDDGRTCTKRAVYLK